MTTVERYIFRTGLVAFLAALTALTGVIWVTQALQQVDLLTTKGQSLLIFLLLTSLTLPSLVMIIAPIALFFAVLFALNRFNGDSELVVMSASGMSPGRLLRPFGWLIGLVVAVVAFMSIWAMPASFRTIRDMITQIRADVITRFVREGQFLTLDQGIVFHYRERGPNGGLRGIFIQDRRDPDRISTYLAEGGQTVESGKENYLLLEKGSMQQQRKGEPDPSMVSFESYAIDLSQFGSEGEGAPLKPRERSTTELFNLDRQNADVSANYGRLAAELHDRFANPLFALAFGLIAFAALGEPKTTRQGRGSAIAVAIVAVVLVRIAGFGASALVPRAPWAVGLVYGVPLAAIAASLAFAFGPPAFLLRFRQGPRRAAAQ